MAKGTDRLAWILVLTSVNSAASHAGPTRPVGVGFGLGAGICSPCDPHPPVLDGVCLCAIADDEDTARILGIDVSRY